MEATLIPHDSRLSVIVVMHPYQAMRIAVVRHVDDLNLLSRPGVEDVDATFGITGRPHLCAVRRKQDVIDLVAREQCFEHLAAIGIAYRDRAAIVAGRFAFVRGQISVSSALRLAPYEEMPVAPAQSTTPVSRLILAMLDEPPAMMYMFSPALSKTIQLAR